MIICPGIAAFDIGLEAVKAFVQDDIDDTGHRVGTPCRRSSPRHHVDALHQTGGHGRKIHAAAERGSHHALAVEQNQRAQDTQITQIDDIHARRAADNEVGGDRSVGAGRGAKRRQLTDRIANIGISVTAQFLRAQHRHRRRLLIAGDGYAGGADDHALDPFFRRFGRRHLNRCRCFLRRQCLRGSGLRRGGRLACSRGGGHVARPFNPAALRTVRDVHNQTAIAVGIGLQIRAPE